MTKKERNSLLAAIIIAPMILLILVGLAMYGFSSTNRLPPSFYEDLK